MKTIFTAALVAAALVLGHLGLRAAEIAKFRHVVSVYADDKGGGLKLPEGVACDGKGRLVIGDTGNDRLVRFSYQQKTVSGGTEVKIPELTAPSHVQLNSKGEIYALDAKRRRIVHLGTEGEFKEPLSFDGVPPPASVVPRSFAIDASDQLYVLDVFSARVIVLDAKGQFQRVLPLPDERGFVSDVAVDFAGNILLVDSIKRRIFSAGKDATGFQPVGVEMADTVITMPASITISGGVIFIVEGSGSSILSFARDGTFLARQLTLGALEGALNHPAQMCVNEKDEVFIADRDNARVQVFGIIR